MIERIRQAMRLKLQYGYTWRAAWRRSGYDITSNDQDIWGI